jgi:hypothetical protein
MARTTDAKLGEPRVEQAIRNPDLFVAGYRVEMVSSVQALLEQLPRDVMSQDDVRRHPFFSRFWAERDRIAVWLRDADPPGERAADVARRSSRSARSLADAPAEPNRHVVCVTHSAPLRALLVQYVLEDDPANQISSKRSPSTSIRRTALSGGSVTSPPRLRSPFIGRRRGSGWTARVSVD